MLLGKAFNAFVEKSPVSVMVTGTIQRIFDPAVLDEIFQNHAMLGYFKKLAFSKCVQIMSDIVFKCSTIRGTA